MKKKISIITVILSAQLAHSQQLLDQSVDLDTPSISQPSFRKIHKLYSESTKPIESNTVGSWKKIMQVMRPNVPSFGLPNANNPQGIKNRDGSLQGTIQLFFQSSDWDSKPPLKAKINNLGREKLNQGPHEVWADNNSMIFHQCSYLGGRINCSAVINHYCRQPAHNQKLLLCRLVLLGRWSDQFKPYIGQTMAYIGFKQTDERKKED